KRLAVRIPTKAASSIAADRDYAEVHIGRQPAIQPNLVLARLMARMSVGEVEKLKAYGLLEFVGEAAGQEDPRNMRLDTLDGIRWMRIVSSVAQPGHQRRCLARRRWIGDMQVIHKTPRKWGGRRRPRAIRTARPKELARACDAPAAA